MITLEQIRKNLQEELRNSGLSQSDIARKLKITSQTVNSYFHGTKLPALDTFANLCKELDIDPAQILCIK